MILKLNLIYAEFLGHLLTIIQNDEERNSASMFSGFLRSTRVSNEVKNLLCKDSAFLPLSAVIKSGCVVEGAIDLTSTKARKLALFCDQARIEGPLVSLGIDRTKYTQIQQLTLVTCIQEATNRVLDGSFRLFAKNVATITNVEHQRHIIDVMNKLAETVLAEIREKLCFEDSTLNLTNDAIRVIKELQQRYLDNENAHNMEIPGEELIVRLDDVIAPSIAERIALLDELTILLATDKKSLDAPALIEYEAHLHLLKLHCTLLSMTNKNLWQADTQWLLPGILMSSDEEEIALPYSISRVLEIIKAKTPGSYLASLRDIQEIARTYETDWYTWIRNKLPIFAAAPAVKEFLTEILAINLETTAADEAVREEPDLLTSVISFGLSFFREPAMPRGDSSSSREVTPLGFIFGCIPQCKPPSPASEPYAADSKINIS